ncbi:MAG: heme-binding protein [Actinomycetes bacterium]|jgi:SOUL heme-binding protein
MTERQKYQVLQTYEGFELRKYDACVVAEVIIHDDYNAAASKAFRYLFNYISKGNDKSAAIAMTAPVIALTESTLESEQWKVHFVMPAGSSLADMPLPNASQVELREIPTENCVAITFRGRATKRLSERKEDALRLAAQKAHFSLSQETRICRFDPPFKPGFLQYNEIVIPTK